MGAGNVLVLKETIKSFVGICDEVVYGDMLLFEEDRNIVKGYQNEFNLKIISLPFDYIYKNGFSSVLNKLAEAASNDLIIYLNTSEVIEIDYGVSEIIDSNPECNSFFFTHSKEKFRWFRCYDRRDLKWQGIIHEDLTGEFRPYHKPIFRMMDLEKDMNDPFKAAVFNSTKECVYWNQLIKIADNPENYPETNEGWKRFAKDTYQSMKDRLEQKGDMYRAMDEGDYEKYMKTVHSFQFENIEFKSSDAIAFQGDKIHLL